MEIAIAGGHGNVARHLISLLVARGDQARGLIRNPAHAGDLNELGATPVVCDLEHAADGEVDAALAGADAIVFAAGAGAGSGAERKWTVDYGGAKRLIDAAPHAGIRRYLMVSAMGTDDPPDDDEVFSVYLRAKAQADADLRAAGLDHTIVRPGRLTDDPATGRVELGVHVPFGAIARADVAAVLVACLDERGTIGRTFDVIEGPTPIAEAIGAVDELGPDRP